ncbi:unnamed protein product [Hymenolepis diminuta]|uniref:SAP domain-containing protein n=1 Tax=Hymenolepis diminuta TaxID=6216 RepID=A0A564XX64_HYMDI|nr:unnamed protein product [Hymenolepis diminuta]
MSDAITLPDGRLVDSLKVAELKKELEVLGLDKNGLKKDLVKRLSEALSDSSHNNSIVDKSVEIPSNNSMELEQPTSITKVKSVTGEQISSVEINRSKKSSDIDPPDSQEPSLHEVETSKAAEDSVREDQRLDTSEVMDTSLQNSTSDNDTQDSSVLAVQTNSTVENTRTVILSSPSTHKLLVELQEEEEDYGSGEEISMDSHPQIEIKKAPKSASQKDAGLNGGKTPITKTVVEFSKRETRVVGVTVEDPVRVNPAKDAKCPVSDLVYIRYLVRPFTQASLRSMLEKNFGTSTVLWLDRIKSSAMARFVDQDTAVKCREGLDGCRWPSINPRVLQCEFGTEALFSWLKENGEAGDKQPPRYLLDPSFTGNVDKSSRPGLDDPQERKRHSADQKRDISGERASKRMKEDSKGGNKDEELVKNLDDLFRKTEAAPMIYWLPLSDEAASAQLKSRQDKFLAEKTRRPVSKRDPEEKKRENRSPFMGEFSGRQQPSRPPPSDPASREKRARETSPSPAGNRSRFLNGRRRSPPTPPRRGRYGNRTPSPRMAAIPSRRPVSPSPRCRRH